MQSFIRKYWLELLPWVLTIGLSAWVIILLHRPVVKIEPPIVDNRIDSLQHVVETLNSDLRQSQHKYDSARVHVRTEIEYIRIKNAKELTNITNLTTAQRDSLWATFKP